MLVFLLSPTVRATEAEVVTLRAQKLSTALSLSHTVFVGEEEDTLVRRRIRGSNTTQTRKCASAVAQPHCHMRRRIHAHTGALSAAAAHPYMPARSRHPKV